MAQRTAKAAMLLCLSGAMPTLSCMAPFGPVAWASAYPAPEADRRHDTGAQRPLASPPPPVSRYLAAYGPFRVLDEARAALVDVTDAGSPDAFSAMLRDHPGITIIEMVNCPGTVDDHANLRLGRMIREHGIGMRVPEHGYVGSGAIELFIAGARRSAGQNSEFAVHSWEDETGREPQDYAVDAAQNRAYLDYYREMGMSEAKALAFYAMTNSAPFSSAVWLTREEISVWIEVEPMPSTLARR